MSDAKVAESAFAAANDLMIDEDYAAALESYNCAIEMNAMMGNYYSNRCMCHLKLKDFESK